MAPKWQAKGDYFETADCQTLCRRVSSESADRGELHGCLSDGTSIRQVWRCFSERTKRRCVLPFARSYRQGNWSAALYLDSRALAERS